jgi:hypothetical protein
LSARTFDQVFTYESGASDLYSCGGGADALGLSPVDSLSGSDKFYEIADTAAWSVLLEKKLNAGGLADVGAPYISSMERLTVQMFGATSYRHSQENYNQYFEEKDSLLGRMAKQLNEWIARRNVRGIRFVAEGGCGAGELLYRIAVNPPTAKVHVIKAFYYMLCQARGVDPLDLQGCFGWQDVLTGKMEGAAGYRYLALWPDGRRQSGSFEVTKAAFERMDSAKLNVVTIKSGR